MKRTLSILLAILALSLPAMAQNSSVPPAYNSNAMYQQGQLLTFNGQLYQCTNPKCTSSVGTPSATSTVFTLISGGITNPAGVPTYTAGTNVTSVVQTTGYTNTNARGSLTIACGTATTGTIATLNFTALLAAPGSVFISQNGGTANYVLGHGVPTINSVTITSGVSCSGATVTLDYWVNP